MKDHEFRELVNQLRDIAVEYRDTQQLRERIAHAINTAMKPGTLTNEGTIQPGNSAQPVTVPDGYVLVPVDLLSDLRDFAHPEIEKYCEMWEGRRDAEFPAMRKIISDADALLAAAQKVAHFREIENSSTGICREIEKTSTKCWCRTCRPVTMNDMRFVVCPDCGNKRCPKANDHRNACTGSNEPGQPGSAYPDAPKGV